MGENAVESDVFYTTPNPFLLNKICFNQNAVEVSGVCRGMSEIVFADASCTFLGIGFIPAS